MLNYHHPPPVPHLLAFGEEGKLFIRQSFAAVWLQGRRRRAIHVHQQTITAQYTHSYSFFLWQQKRSWTEANKTIANRVGEEGPQRRYVHTRQNTQEKKKKTLIFTLVIFCRLSCLAPTTALHFFVFVSLFQSDQVKCLRVFLVFKSAVTQMRWVTGSKATQQNN